MTKLLQRIITFIIYMLICVIAIWGIYFSIKSWNVGKTLLPISLFVLKDISIIPLILGTRWQLLLNLMIMGDLYHATYPKRIIR